MPDTSGFPLPPTRRSVVAAAGGAGLAAALAACGSDSSSPSDGAASSAPATTGEPSATPTSGSASASASAQGGGTALAKTSEIPVGGGKVFADRKVVVTQPAAGQFKAFSATCTHAGCAVADVSGGTINCPCHGSKFKVADGSVANGPATSPLPEQQVTVSGDEITLA